jgi:hypothetical protein
VKEQQHAGVPLVVSVLLRELRDFLSTLKPALRPGGDTRVTGEPG